MKRTFRGIAVICLAFAFSVIMFTLGIAAMGNMAGTNSTNGGMAGNSGAGAMSGVESSGGIGDRAGIDSGDGDNTMYDGNIDSGTDGHIDDTGSGDMNDNPIGNAAGDMVRGAENAVEDTADAVTGGMGIWGVIIAVVIIAAILALIFAFFRKR